MAEIPPATTAPSTTPTPATTPTSATIDDLGWSSTIWEAMVEAVHQETRRTNIAQKILPLYGPLPDAMNVPSDTVGTAGVLRINEGASTILNEVYVQFTMTRTQVQQQAQDMSTALTLATRAANLVAIGQDHLIFRGTLQNLQQPLQNHIQRSADNNVDVNNLLGVGDNPDIQEIDPPVQRAQQNPARYNENTVTAVQTGISSLQGQGHYGPYALVLHTNIFADAHNPLEDTLIMPADRIKPLVEKGFYGSGALLERRGVLLSVGGNTIDLAIGVDATPEYVSQVYGGRYLFRVFERFALRLKDPTAVRRIRFL